MAEDAHSYTLHKILVCCGAGVSTSLLVCSKLEALLNAEGYEGTYTIDSCRSTEAAELSANYSMLVSTTGEPEGLACPYVNGIPFLNGLNEGAAEARVLAILG